MTAVRFSNNSGQTAPCGALDAAPVHGSSQTATDAATGGDHTLTVEAGHTYLVACTEVFVFGLAAVTTAANVSWICEADRASVIHMPVGYTALHYQSLVNGGIVYLIELAQ